MRFEKRDWGLAVGITLAALALRVPFRAEYGYYWDSVQFALAVEHFDMPGGLPHPPGFFLYVMLGRLVNLLVGEPHTALLWINLVAGAVLAGAGYLLGRALFGWRCGLFTGLILASSPLSWFHSEFALTTVPDALLVVLLVLVCWRVIQGGGSWGQVIGLALLMAVIGGFRSQTAPGLLPLWLYSFWRIRQQRWAKLAVGVGLTGVLGLVWFVPLLWISGGWQSWWSLVQAKAHFDVVFRFFGGGFPALAQSVMIVTASLLLGLALAGLLAVGEYIRFVLRTPAEARVRVYRAHAEPLRLLALWIVPQVLFGTVLMYTFAPGYILSYFPAVAILVGWGLARLSQRLGGRDWIIGAAVVVVNAWLFLGEPFGLTRLPRLAMSAPELQRQSRQLAAWFRVIRQRFQPGEVEIWHAGQWYLYGIRHFQYFLPEYENWLLTPDRALASPLNRRYWRVQDRRVEFVAESPQAGKRSVLLIVPPGGRLSVFGEQVELGRVVEIPVPGGAPLYWVRPEG